MDLTAEDRVAVEIIRQGAADNNINLTGAKSKDEAGAMIDVLRSLPREFGDRPADMISALELVAELLGDE